MGKGVTLIDSSKVIQLVAEKIKKDKKLNSSLGKNNKQIYFASDSLNNFKEIAERFLGRKTKSFVVELDN